ncbi:response regulator [Fluviispira vulneris]|uniref:response regulator n=1 Tax=Fluviispira vulneris TaxID=2763012 RepID=UPI001645E46C|nr:response regulator [Fluviispira vulneris]
MQNSNNLKKILVIDDSELDAFFIDEGLKNKNFQCFILEKTELVMQTIEDNSIDIILLDILMPNSDGNDILKKIREKYNKFELPVIMITSLNDHKNLDKSIKQGANDYITKPFHIDIAIARINNQIVLSDLYKENLQKKEIETINSIIITYNHEINNSLAIAMLALNRIENKLDEDDLQLFSKAKNALKRIEDTLKKINEIENKGISWEVYAQDKRNKILK